jgi:hypothetical protein
MANNKSVRKEPMANQDNLLKPQDKAVRSKELLNKAKIAYTALEQDWQDAEKEKKRRKMGKGDVVTLKEWKDFNSGLQYEAFRAECFLEEIFPELIKFKPKIIK